MLDAGVGISTESNGYDAGREAAKQAMSPLSTTPKLAILVIDGLTRKRHDYAAVIKGVREEIGPLPRLLGSTVNGVLINDRFALHSVGLMLLGGDIEVEADFKFGRSRIEWQKIADAILNKKKSLETKPNQCMMMFQDGIKFPPEIMEQQKMLNSRMVSLLSGLVGRLFAKKLSDFQEVGKGMPSVNEIVGALYDKGWDIPIIGNVATILRDYDSNEFYDKEVTVDAICGAIISGTEDTKFGYGFAAGAEATGVTCRPTKNIGNFLLRINDKPALEGFCESINLEPESLRNLANDAYINFYYMLGTSNDVAGRQVIHLTGTITSPETPNLIVTAFPFNKVPGEAQIFRSSTKILMKTTKDAIVEATQNISTPRFLLGIECAERLLAYADNYPKAIEIMRDTIGADVPRMIIGSGGEIFGYSKRRLLLEYVYIFDIRRW